jgi:hypothetical protein
MKMIVAGMLQPAVWLKFTSASEVPAASNMKAIIALTMEVEHSSEMSVNF